MRGRSTARRRECSDYLPEGRAGALLRIGNLVPRGKDTGVLRPISARLTLDRRVRRLIDRAGTRPGHTSGPTCMSVATQTVQSNVTAEQNSLNSKMNFLKIFPIISLGFGYAF